MFKVQNNLALLSLDLSRHAVDDHFEIRHYVTLEYRAPVCHSLMILSYIKYRITVYYLPNNNQTYRPLTPTLLRHYPIISLLPISNGRTPTATNSCSVAISREATPVLTNSFVICYVARLQNWANKFPHLGLPIGAAVDVGLNYLTGFAGTYVNI